MGKVGFFLPEFELTPQAIFKNEIVAFDVNFFNPKKIKKYTDKRDVLSMEFHAPSYANRIITIYGYKETFKSVNVEIERNQIQWYWMNDEQYKIFQNEYGFSDKNAGYSGEYNSRVLDYNIMHWANPNDEIDIEEKAANERQWEHDGKTYRAYYSYGGYHWGVGNYYGICLLREVELGDYYTVELEPETSAAYELQSTISAWYITFRNIALVALLSILVYIGIRITLSSVASDKAKYKEMMVDWVVAICLVFLMHYIMSFSVYINEKIIDSISSITVSSYGGEKGVLGNQEPTIGKTQAKIGQSNEQVEEENEIKDAGVQLFIIEGEDAKNAYNILVGSNEDVLTDADGNIVSGENSLYINRFSEDKTKLYWKANDFMAQARILGQQIEVDKDGKEINSEQTEGERAGYNIIYIVLVIYTVVFCLTYLRRVVYMAFLTIIAPLVAITYPIDKMNDGKAQAFNMWLKEYIFNLLIQPLHLILYTILVGSAMKFAATNIFYVVIALGFLIPAEKLLRRFFGFEKAQTPGAFGGAAGAALMMTGLNKLMSHRPSKEAIGTANRPKDEDEEGKDKPIMNKKLEDRENLFGNNKDDEEGLFIDNENEEENNLGYHKDLTEEQIDELRAEGLEPGDQEYNQYLREHGINPNENVPNTQISTDNIQIPKTSKRRIEIPRRKRSIGRGIKRGLKSYGGALQKRYTANGGIIRKGLRMAGGVAGAATLATAGGLIGIASGDPSKAAQYIATGATGGYSLGKRAVNSVSNKIKSGSDTAKIVAREAKKGYYGDDNKEHEQERYKKQFIKDQENLRKIEDKLRVEEKEAKEIAKRIADYTDYEGVNSVEDAIAVDQLVQEENYKLEEALMAASYSNVILEGKDTRHMKRDELREYQHAYKERLEEKGISPNDSKLHTARLFRAINQFNNFKN